MAARGLRVTDEEGERPMADAGERDKVSCIGRKVYRDSILTALVATAAIAIIP